MPNLIVIAFDNPDEAEKVREAIHEMEKAGRISLDDSAVVVKDENGKIHVKNEVDRGVKVGAAAGGLLGLFVTLLFAPIAGLVLGVIGGGLIGSAADLGVSKKFVKDVEGQLKPGTSALFVIIREGDPTAAVALLKPFEGQVIQTTLPSEAEDTLREVLSKRIN